ICLGPAQMGHPLMMAFLTNFHVSNMQASRKPSLKSNWLVSCFLAKTDIQSAFRIVPVHPDAYELLCFSWEGKFYYDRCLAFGASSRCRIFERVSSALEWIALSKLRASAVVKILDDFLFIENAYDGCLQTLQSFLKMCNTVGISIADKKTFPPHTTMTFVGFSLDSLRMETSLPSEKNSQKQGTSLLSLSQGSLLNYENISPCWFFLFFSAQ
ncbi:MAG: hypothetical protein AB2784_16615, partial [Candidatus Thiodiazotropha endolucinida]